MAKAKAQMVEIERQVGGDAPAFPTAASSSDVEITQEMISAGLKVFASWEDSEDYRAENLVSEIYRQMQLTMGHH